MNGKGKQVECFIILETRARIWYRYRYGYPVPVQVQVPSTGTGYTSFAHTMSGCTEMMKYTGYKYR